MRGDGLFAAGIEIEVLGIGGDFEADEIVAAGGVDIGAGIAEAFFVARHAIQTAVGIVRSNAGPVVEAAVDGDGHFGAGDGGGTDALVFADETDHLVVIVIGMSAFHGFDVAAVFLIVLVHEEGVAGLNRFAQHVSSAVVWIFDESLGHPLIPAGDEGEFGRDFQGPLNLLREIGAFVSEFGQAVAVDRRLLIVEMAAADVGYRVLGNSDG